MKSWELLGEEPLTPDQDHLPGAQLKSKREEKGLSIEKVAETLHLHPRQIVALESDDYSVFSAPIFVVGYMRNYARLLGIDPEPLLSNLGHQAAKTPEVQTEPVVATPRQWLPSQSSALIGLLAVVVILLATWALNRGPSATAPEGADVSMATVPEETDSAISASDPQATTEQEAVPQEPATRATGELVLRFSGDSWVEVTDADGKRLVGRMGRKDEELKLRGPLPLSVLLGNALNVRVEYNGEPYRDIPISRQNVASFKLGQPAND